MTYVSKDFRKVDLIPKDSCDNLGMQMIKELADKKIPFASLYDEVDEGILGEAKIIVGEYIFI